MYCSNCGKYLGDCKFCSECGAIASSDSMIQKKSTSSKLNNSKKNVIVGFVFVFVAIFLAIVVLVSIILPFGGISNKNPAQRALIGTWKLSDDTTFTFKKNGTVIQKSDGISNELTWSFTETNDDEGYVNIYYGGTSMKWYVEKTSNGKEYRLAYYDYAGWGYSFPAATMSKK